MVRIYGESLISLWDDLLALKMSKIIKNAWLWNNTGLIDVWTVANAFAEKWALQSVRSPGRARRPLIWSPAFWDALLNSHKGADLIPSCAVATQPTLQMSRLRPFSGGSSELAPSNVCIEKEAARWRSSRSEREAGPDDLQRSLTNNVFMILWFCFLSITQNIRTVRSV